MPRPPASPPANLFADPLTDLPGPPTLLCIRCGYDLTGLPRFSACPECEMSAEESARASLLDASPRYLSRLRWAARFFTVGVAMATISLATSAAYMRQLLWGNTTTPSGWLLQYSTIILWLGHAADAIWWAGLWSLTAGEPTAFIPTLAFRRWLRGIAAALALLTVAAWAVEEGLFGLAAAPLLPILETGAGALIILVFCLIPRYIARIAHRLPDRAVTRRARRLQWWIPLLATPYLLTSLAYATNLVTIPWGTTSTVMRLLTYAFFVVPDALIFTASLLIALLARQLARAVTAPPGTA